VDDPRLRVCLDRVVELAGARLTLRDWPGVDGPLVHVPDPLTPTDDVAIALAEAFAPRQRVVSLSPRGGAPYQVDAADLLATLEQFGFAQPTLVGERLGCVPALLLAAWYPERVERLVLVDPTYERPLIDEDTVVARALRDCPPDWSTLRAGVRCPMLVVRWNVNAVEELTNFLSGPPATPHS
jgi:pimeloyl-ACP methyl ester carboxylesterase